MTAKKTAATKAAAKTAETKATEVKATVDTKPAKAAKEEVKAEVKEEAVKAETKKTAAKTAAAKTTEKKPAVKKTTAKKTVAKKPEVTRQVFVQFGGREVASVDIMNKVEAAWTAMGNKAEDMTDVKVYIKPEEFMAYYVINGDVTGGVEM